MVKKVAVIGAGVMGCGIAAQIANNNIEVLLYDLENESGMIAEQSIKKQLDNINSQFVHPSVSKFVTPKSLIKDLKDIYECDIIIEAIVENIDIKKSLYKDLSSHMKDGSIIASNTSTFSLSQLAEGANEKIKESICICHFFNPPRYMRLLEFVSGGISALQKTYMIEFLTNKLGKEVIECKDTPGFIANRLGCYLMELVFNEALNTDLTIEEIDFAFTKYFGFPSTGIFGLYDLIGLDVMGYIKKSLLSSLSDDDDFHKISKNNLNYQNFVKNGFTGRKGKGGFYKQEKDENGKKRKYALDLKTFEYRPYNSSSLDYETTAVFLESSEGITNFIKKIFTRFLSYVSANANLISYGISDVDRALKLGFAWKYGPFELAQKFDLAAISDKEKFNSTKLDYKKINVNPNMLVKNSVIFTNGSCSLWRLKDTKICFEITTKLNILTEEVFDGIISACEAAENNSSDLIIYSDAPNFSAGADLKTFYKHLISNDKESLLKYLSLGQKAIMRLKYCKSSVISCARGVALGGGCEILLHSDYIVAHQDLQAGLVESSIGLLPGWGGLKEMLIAEAPEKNIQLVFKGYKSSSAVDFAINYKKPNLTSLANTNNILNYALENSFHKMNNKIAKLDFTNFMTNNTSWNEGSNNLFKSKIKLCKTEEDLLSLEREMFVYLLFNGDAREKIEKII